MISTRGRYALRFLVDLAENNGGFVTMKEIAERQQVSIKYAERIFVALSEKNFLDTKHGKGGGYKLNRAPEDYKLSEILLALGEKLTPVACLSCQPNSCPRAKICKTLPMWQKLGNLIYNFFENTTLADLLNSGAEIS